MPQILANDVSPLLAYEVAPGGEEYAIVKFIQPCAHYFGSPNDETMRGHPLAACRTQVSVFVRADNSITRGDDWRIHGGCR